MPRTTGASNKSGAGSGEKFNDADNATVEMGQDEDIWYFGYGPIVHPQVRQRRDVQTSQSKACVLRDHKLTFAFGAVATVVPKMGWTVHGVLMKVDNAASWKKLQDFDSGYHVQELDVYPYDKDEYDLEESDRLFEETVPVSAFVFCMNELDDPDMDLTLVEKKPQERYLQLIAQGMTQQGVDETYVENEIMSCPYVPNRKPQEWWKFPVDEKAVQKEQAKLQKKRRKNHRQTVSSESSPPQAPTPSIDLLPPITMEAYQKLCQKQSTSTANEGGGEVYFILQNAVLQLGPHQAANPSVQWMKGHAHGQADISHLVHLTVVDPCLPYAPTMADMTPDHMAWAEDQTFDILQQSGLTATKVYRLLDERNTIQDPPKKSRAMRQWIVQSLSLLACGSNHPHQHDDDHEADLTKQTRQLKQDALSEEPSTDPSRKSSVSDEGATVTAS